MRIKYIGLDHRVRIAEANRVKFIDDGFQHTDNRLETDESIKGPIIVAHVYRSKGGKRLTIEVPEGFDMAAAEQHLLEHNWLDVSSCIVRFENFY